MTVRAVAYTEPGPADVLEDVEIEVGPPGPHDLLVEVRAVSVNPVDVKVRASSGPEGDAPRVLGFDAAGVVLETGDAVTRFAPGDAVFYAGTIARPGSNAERQLVDERIAGPKPQSIGFEQAAALPLTSLTAWETLFDHFEPGHTGSLLVLAAAGGVGSMVCQLARQLTGLEVIAAASRPESVEWATEMGAHRAVDRTRLVEELGESSVDYVFTPFSEGNVESFATVLRPRGRVVAIDEPEGLDTLPLKDKSQSWHWQLMFTRSLHEPESDAQHRALTETARLVDAGRIRSTLTTTLGPLSAQSLAEAHRRLESSETIGKVVLPV